MRTELDRYRQIAEECRALAEDAKPRIGTEVQAILNERALLSELMADAMSRAVARLRGWRPQKPVR